MNELIQQIEERYSVKLPEEFVEFWRRGFCSIPALRTVGPNYLWVPEMEWMPLEEIRDYHFPSYQKVCMPLLPFSFDGGGSPFCFMLGEGEQMAILWCKYDCIETEVFAPHFLAAIFRSFLFNSEEATDHELHSHTLNHSKNGIRLLNGLLPSSQIDILTEIYNRRPRVVGKDLLQLISTEERQEIERTHFPEFDPQKSVRWRVD